MPRVVPKPKLTPTGQWKLRITIPRALRAQGFAGGKRELIEYHPPCSAPQARAWAGRIHLEFCAALDAARSNPAAAISGPEQQAFRRLFHKQKDQNAAAASGAIFDQHLAALMASHNVRLTPADHQRFANEWDAIASKPGGDKVLEALAVLTGNRVDHDSELAAWLSLHNATAKTRKIYEADVRTYLDAVGREEPFVREVFVTWHNDQLRRGGITLKTLKRKCSALRGYQAHLLEVGAIAEHSPEAAPLTGLSTHKKRASVASIETKPWSDAEIWALYTTAQQEQRHTLAAAMALAIFTGGRIESLFRIKASDVNLDDQTLVIGAEGDKTDAGANRLIPLARPLLPTIETLMAATSTPSDYLLPSSSKTAKRSDPPGKAFGRLKERLLNQPGRAKSFHSFRKSMITKLANQVQAPRQIIADIVGHEDKRDVTMGLYRQRSTPEQMREFLDQLHYEGWTP